MIRIVFEDDIDLMHFADEFIVKDRLASLENDVNRCLRGKIHGKIHELS